VVQRTAPLSPAAQATHRSTGQYPMFTSPMAQPGPPKRGAAHCATEPCNSNQHIYAGSISAKHRLNTEGSAWPSSTWCIALRH
jgi:hypothetical protein